MVELVPLPVPKQRRARLATTLSPMIDRHGPAVVAEQRIHQMSDPKDPNTLTSRILKNMVLAFSERQLRNLVRRELIEITGKSWKSMRKA